MYINRIKLDVTPGDESKIVHISQYDKETHNLEFELCSSDERLMLPDDVTAEINGTTPDGNDFLCEASIEDGVVSVELTEKMTALAGEVPCTITIASGSDQLMKESFILMVDREVADKDPLIPDSGFAEVKKLMDRLDAIVEAAVIAEKASESVDRVRKQIDKTAEEITQTRDRALNAIETAKKLAVGVVDDKAQDVRRMKLNSDEVARKAFKRANELENRFTGFKKPVDDGMSSCKTESGTASTDANGLVYIYLSDPMKETAGTDGEYKVFLQEEEAGNVYVVEKTESYFTVKGTDNLAFSWLVIV